MRIARLRTRLSVRPRVALEVDGVHYDVATLEEVLGAAVPVIGDPSDFETRVVSMACAGLGELEARLVRGERPSRARLRADELVVLAPCDTERAAFVEVDLRGSTPTVRATHARCLEGDGAFVDLPGGGTTPSVELWLAAVVGDELRAATEREARQAILGTSVALSWIDEGLEAAMRARGLGSSRGWRAQLGPALHVGGRRTPPAARRGALRRGGAKLWEVGLEGLAISLEDAVARASALVRLDAGDVVAVGPLGPSGEAASRVEVHDEVGGAITDLGELRGTAVPRATR